MDTIKPFFAATASCSGGRNGHTQADEQICPYSHATRNNVPVELTVSGA